MEIIEVESYEELSKKAADEVCAQINKKPESVLGLMTGETPKGMYAELKRRCARREVDFSRVTTFNLDEYKGLSGVSDKSFYYYMYNELFNGINILPEQAHLFCGAAADPDAECARYDLLMEKAGCFDIQLLGLGLNGHIGFNEPAEAFAVGTRCARLTSSTMNNNARFFASVYNVPTHAYAIGVDRIMSSERIILLVNGAHKAGILRLMLAGDITPKVPASVLRLHKNVTVYADSEALSQL